MRGRMHGRTTAAADLTFMLRTSVEGVGPKTAQLLVDHFGTDIVSVLSSASAQARLQQVPGIGRSKAAKIKTNWDEQAGTQVGSLRGVGGVGLEAQLVWAWACASQGQACGTGRQVGRREGRQWAEAGWQAGGRQWAEAGWQAGGAALGRGRLAAVY
eukprot:366454-Chlamydomonas_euryale.AAC.5